MNLKQLMFLYCFRENCSMRLCWEKMAQIVTNTSKSKVRIAEYMIGKSLLQKIMLLMKLCTTSFEIKIFNFENLNFISSDSFKNAFISSSKKEYKLQNPFMLKADLIYSITRYWLIGMYLKLISIWNNFKVKMNRKTMNTKIFFIRVCTMILYDQLIGWSSWLTIVIEVEKFRLNFLRSVSSLCCSCNFSSRYLMWDLIRTNSGI